MQTSIGVEMNPCMTALSRRTRCGCCIVDIAGVCRASGAISPNCYYTRMDRFISHGWNPFVDEDNLQPVCDQVEKAYVIGVSGEAPPSSSVALRLCTLPLLCQRMVSRDASMGVASWSPVRAYDGRLASIRKIGEGSHVERCRS